MAEEVSVQADPTPEPTPEEQGRLRLQLQRDLAMHESSGNTDLVEAVKARLAELPEPEEVVTEEVVEETNDTGTGHYEDRTVEQLKTLLESKGMPTSGNKDELIARLREG